MLYSEKLRQLRIQNNYSQEQLAELLNVSRQAISKWESGNGLPDIENIKATAHLFDVTLDSLLIEGEEIQKTEEDFCWQLSFACGGIAYGLSWLVKDIMNITPTIYAIGGGFIGFFVAYVIFLFRKKKH